MKSYQFKPPYLKAIYTDRLRVWRKSKLYKLYKKYPPHSLYSVAIILAVLFLSIVRVYAQPEPVIEVGIPIPKYERLEPIKAKKQAKVQYATVKVEKPSVAPNYASGGLNPSHGAWYELAMCESTNNPRAVDPSGTYFGLFQFDLQTWQSNGGSGNPIDNPAEEQLRVAKILHSHRGFQPWPSCGANL